MIQKNHILLLLTILLCSLCYSLVWRSPHMEIMNLELSDRQSTINATYFSTLSPDIKEVIQVGGTCGQKAYEAGDRQKIIVYTLYGNMSGYYIGLTKILRDVERVYPGWFVRIYTDEPNSQYITNLTDVYDRLHVCDVLNLPPPTTSLANYPKMMWRYFPLGDPQVEVVLFRDTDSPILDREGAAVSEWLTQSNKSLHIMRDHPFHAVAIPGGMWGAKMTDKNRSKWRSARNSMFKKAYKSKQKMGLDQWLLAIYVWPRFLRDAYSHDSFTCWVFLGSKPFPTQRVNGTFIGAPIYKNPSHGNITNECPILCRPKNHKDWKYC